MSITTTPKAETTIRGLLEKGVNLSDCRKNLAQILSITPERVDEIAASISMSGVTVTEQPTGEALAQQRLSEDRRARAINSAAYRQSCHEED